MEIKVQITLSDSVIDSLDTGTCSQQGQGVPIPSIQPHYVLEAGTQEPVIISMWNGKDGRHPDGQTLPHLLP